MPLNKIYLFNDASKGHAGSKQIMKNLYKELEEFDIVAKHYVHELEYDEEKMKECDIVLVNGEGTIHHDAPAGLFLLDMLRKGQELNKVTMLINSVFQEITGYEDVISNLDFFSVREQLSYEYALTKGGSPVKQLDLCFSGGTGTIKEKLKGKYKGQTHGWSVAKNALSTCSYPTLKLQWDYLDFVATLSQVDLYVTGQHHGVYACALAKVPFIPITGNSHKIEGIIKWSGAKIPVCYSAKDVENYPVVSQEEYDKFFKFFRNAPRFSKNDIYDTLKKKYQKKLSNAINGRPVGFLALGHSLKDLEDRIEDFRDKDICWISLNQINEPRRILNKIGRNLDVIVGYAVGFEEEFKDESCYVHRYVRKKNKGNTLFEFLLQCINIGVKKVVLFGADGWSETDKPFYGEYKLMQAKSDEDKIKQHKRDCMRFNELFPSDTKNTEILNCSLNSKYEPFEKITIDEALKRI